ncbi:hypothetical protein [Paraherbaspirillum soli]|uniref:Transposase n=1 Tax=Paraherbaspirillum soli TaxID=631222 RepID=A0ABW0MHQ3_9BURK
MNLKIKKYQDIITFDHAPKRMWLLEECHNAKESRSLGWKAQRLVMMKEMLGFAFGSTPTYHLSKNSMMLIIAIASDSVYSRSRP